MFDEEEIEHGHDDQDDGLRQSSLRLYPKQIEALGYLTDSETFHLAYGGSVRASKTYTGAVWCHQLCHNHAGIRGVVIRKSRNLLERDFIASLAEVYAHMFGEGTPLSYTVTKGSNLIVTYGNGSTITMLGMDDGRDAFHYKLKGWSGAFAIIEEAQEQDSDSLLSAVGGRLSQAGQYGLIPKVLLTCNPAPPEHWLYRTFYQPWKENNLPVHRKFIQALPTDNESLDESWHKMQLATMSPDQLQIDYYGRWEYVRAQDHLFDKDALLRSFVPEGRQDGQQYVTVDVATDHGKDRTVITHWHGWDMIGITASTTMNSQELVHMVQNIQHDHSIPANRVIVDANGVGWAVSQQLNAVPFMASAAPHNGEPFQHMKAQVFYRLAERVNKGEVRFVRVEPKMQGIIMEELSAHKMVDPYREAKSRVSTTADVKAAIHRSPDLASAISFRAWFDWKDDTFDLEWL